MIRKFYGKIHNQKIALNQSNIPDMKKKIKVALKFFLNTIRKIYFSFIDIYDLIFTQKDNLIPPKRLGFAVGNGDFKQIGNEYLNYFVDLGGLKTTDCVLDVGCGIGRMAVPLTNYLSKNAFYEGFDIVKSEILWCKKNITPCHPNFNFQLADIYNYSYNPHGKNKASEYIFPYSDRLFDFIFLTSVFTHMLPCDVENYISEISRVLKKDGRCLITFFLLNDKSLEYISKRKSKWSLKYDYGIYRVEDDEMPERVVAYSEKYIEELLTKYNLSIHKPIQYGTWYGREDMTTLQDLVVTIKQ